MTDATGGEGPQPVIEVEFIIENSSNPFIAASEDDGCSFELAEMVPRSDGRYAEFFNVVGADPDRILDRVGAYDSVEATLLAEYDSGGLFEFLVSGNCPAFRLAELGALPRTVQGRNGEGRIAAEIPVQYDPSAVIETFLEEYPDAELAAKRRNDSATPLFSRATFGQALHAYLTGRQREVLRAAFEAGYYDWPRKCTGEDVADELGISSATFSEHIHAAERNLLTALFDGPQPNRPGGS